MGPLHPGAHKDNSDFKRDANECRHAAADAIRNVNNMTKRQFENCITVQIILGVVLNFSKIIILNQ